MWFYDIEEASSISNENKISLKSLFHINTKGSVTDLGRLLVFMILIVILAIFVNFIGWVEGAKLIISGVVTLMVGVGWGEYNTKKDIEMKKCGIRFVPKYQKYLRRKK
jgi:FtsH-binding integral membrane protein